MRGGSAGFKVMSLLGYSAAMPFYLRIRSNWLAADRGAKISPAGRSLPRPRLECTNIRRLDGISLSDNTGASGPTASGFPSLLSMHARAVSTPGPELAKTTTDFQTQNPSRGDQKRVYYQSPPARITPPVLQSFAAPPRTRR